MSQQLNLSSKVYEIDLPDIKRKKPPWLKKSLPPAASRQRMKKILRANQLHTVCESALCPNLGECFAQGNATFLILGDTCTRSCRFCAVPSGSPLPVDPEEPMRVAEAVRKLALRHVVITSVTRDDLPDGGAAQYAATIRAVRTVSPRVTIEVLTSDFAGSSEALDLVLTEQPEVFSHNLETVPRLYASVRPQAIFECSLDVLRRAVQAGCGLVKTGWMVGLGETSTEVEELFKNIAKLKVDLVTIGQYLSPSKNHFPVRQYIFPEIFEEYKIYGESLGLNVNAAPFVRSSFHAGEIYELAIAK